MSSQVKSNTPSPYEKWNQLIIQLKDSMQTTDRWIRSEQLLLEKFFGVPASVKKKPQQKIPRISSPQLGQNLVHLSRPSKDDLTPIQSKNLNIFPETMIFPQVGDVAAAEAPSYRPWSSSADSEWMKHGDRYSYRYNPEKFLVPNDRRPLSASASNIIVSIINEVSCKSINVNKMV